MAGNVVINDSAYEVNGGNVVVGGSTYNVTGGKAVVDGTTYDVSFVNGVLVYVRYVGDLDCATVVVNNEEYSRDSDIVLEPDTVVGLRVLMKVDPDYNSAVYVDYEGDAPRELYYTFMSGYGDETAFVIPQDSKEWEIVMDTYETGSGYCEANIYINRIA